eukprot:g7416.t1 g7416   contig24:567288-568520(-)
MVLSNSLVLLLSGGGLIYRATAANCGAALGGVLCSEPSHCCSEYGYCGIGDEYQTGKKGKLLKLVGLDVGGEGRAWMHAPESWPGYASS